tara:strand:+ start:42 stop:335 length:294 start_codon:yes stop_codon:yes gene_type:complete
MANLSTKIKLYIETNSATWEDKKVSLQDDSDGNGVYIKTWAYSFTKPTDSQLDALETQANTYEENLTTDKANNIASAKTKLKALGLSVDEIKEAFGI